MSFCPKCGKQIADEAVFCPSCGYGLRSTSALSSTPTLTDILAVTTPVVPGFKVVKVLGIIHGMTARTRGIGGKIIGGLQSLVGGRSQLSLASLKKQKMRLWPD
jgi:hypothetical protein